MSRPKLVKAKPVNEDLLIGIFQCLEKPKVVEALARSLHDHLCMHVEKEVSKRMKPLEETIKLMKKEACTREHQFSEARKFTLSLQDRVNKLEQYLDYSPHRAHVKGPDNDPPPVSLPGPLTSRHESDSDSDREGIVPVAPAKPGNADVVSVTISHLSLHKGADILSDPEVDKLFVEYRFLGLPAEELETPFSLPKPGPNKAIAFNFQKRFNVDFDKNHERRQYLASMLLPSDPDKGRIRFKVVSDPPESGDGDCVDVGTASVSLPQAYREQRDLMGVDLPIYDVDDTSKEIGTLNVSLQCLAALNAVNTEMQEKTIRPR